MRSLPDPELALAVASLDDRHACKERVLSALDAKTTAYEPCATCGGSGLVLSSYTGEPTDCRDCTDGLVRARDPRGRFTTRIVS